MAFCCFPHAPQEKLCYGYIPLLKNAWVYETRSVFFDFSLTVKAAPHEYVIRTGQP